jgi:hypothetical protein
VSHKVTSTVCLGKPSLQEVLVRKTVDVFVMFLQSLLNKTELKFEPEECFLNSLLQHGSRTWLSGSVRAVRLYIYTYISAGYGPKIRSVELRN